MFCYVFLFSDSDDEQRSRKAVKKDILDPETVDALGEFSFLKDEKVIANKKRVDNGGEWGVNQHFIDQMKEKFRCCIFTIWRNFFT